MFKRSRRKITALVMITLFCILAVMLCVIYFTTYREINHENRDMLEMYAELYKENGVPDGTWVPPFEEESETDGAGETDGFEDNNTGDADGSGGNESGGNESGDTADIDEPGETESGDAASESAGAEASAGFGSQNDGSIQAENDTAKENAAQADSGQNDSTRQAGGAQSGSTQDSGGEIDLDDDTEENIENRRYSVTTFYSVSFHTDGSVQITNDSVPNLSEEEIEEFASALLSEDKTFGTKDNVVYLITETEDFTLVTMMDNTILGESIASLVRYTLLFGAIFLVAAFFISRALSKWIILPLESAYEKQGQFISDAGHELKTPIATVSANAELLSREVGENAWLANIRYENERMSELVSRLLNLAEMEKAQLLREEVDFSRLVLEGILPFEGIAFERGVRMDYAIDEDVKLQGDSMKLGELISVLIDNAIEHTQPEGLIRVTLTADHGSAVFAIENQGEEIPEQEREKIFERFYRVDEARTGTNAHYGLGLSIARAVVQAHNGRIAVSCEDGFTRFEVTFVL